MFRSTSMAAGRVSMTRKGLRRADTVYLLVFVIFTAIALLDPAQVLPLAVLTLSNLAHTSIYMLIAVLLLAGVKATGAETMVAGIFTGREHRMIFLAALVGGLAPFCSCEVIPFIAGLLALGTPLPPIMAFWLSSPLIDPPTLLITAGALGWTFAISKAIFAVAIGLFGGYTVKLILTLGYLRTPLKRTDQQSNHACCSLDSYQPPPCCAEHGQKNSQTPVWRFWLDKTRINTFFFQFKSNGLFLFKWMLFAYSLESLMIHYVPVQTISSVLGGDGIWPIILSAFIGVPAYLNSYIAPPVVSGLIDQGMSEGSGMTFIMAGAISSIPAMTAVYALVRKQVFAVYVLLGLSGAIGCGLIYNAIG